MKIIWTKSTKPLSLLIRWVFNEPVSHVAFVFDHKLVIHSNLLGVNLQWFNTFKKHCEIVYCKEYDLTLEQEEEIYQGLLDTYDGASYDWGAFIFLAYRGLLWRLFNIPIPNKNPWAHKGMFLCDELVTVLPPWLVELPNDVDFGIMTPYKVYNILKEQEKI